MGVGGWVEVPREVKGLNYGNFFTNNESTYFIDTHGHNTRAHRFCVFQCSFTRGTRRERHPGVH